MSNVTYNYTYDDLYRLTEFKQGTTSIRSYQYDHNGNLTQKGSASFTYANDNNQLTSTGSVNYLYDLAGRVTKIGSDSLLYDCLDNMTAHANDEYGYDADNNRIFRVQNGDSTWYFRHGMDVLSEYRTGSSNDGIDSVEYIYGVEGKLVQLDFDKGYTKLLW
ncbi:hypothetical protein GF406_05085 [candidate division KSB1 bacterium]|nr:hypothetical protein [candidate division KSB1 bacterium]